LLPFKDLIKTTAWKDSVMIQAAMNDWHQHCFNVENILMDLV